MSDIRREPPGFEHVVFGGERQGLPTQTPADLSGRRRPDQSGEADSVLGALLVALPVDAREEISPAWVHDALCKIPQPQLSRGCCEEAVRTLASLQLVVMDPDGSLVFYEAAGGIHPAP